MTVAFAAEKIKVGYFNNEPHISQKADKPAGYLVDFWEKQIAPEMKVEVEWVGPVPPVRLLEMLKGGEINCIALLSKNPEREQLYDYPEKPFQKVIAGLAVPSDSIITKISSPSDLADKKVAFFKNGFIPASIKPVKVSWDFLFGLDWKVQGLNKALLKRVDGVFEPDLTTLKFTVENSPEFKGKFNFVEIPGTESENYSIFSKSDNKKFMDLYNAALTKALSSKSYQSLIAP